jgi:RNA polymerase sigma-70 factor, ECF subfamily
VLDRCAVGFGLAFVAEYGETSQGRTRSKLRSTPVHSDAPTAAQTDWSQILALYGQLLAVTPTPIIALNRAIAVAELDGPQVALDLIDKLPLDCYYLYHAIHADLLRRAPAERSFSSTARTSRMISARTWAGGGSPSGW